MKNGLKENSVQTPGKTKKRADFEQIAEVNGRFARDSARKSLGNGLLMTKWLDAQEKVLDQYEVRSLELIQPAFSNARRSFDSQKTYKTGRAGIPYIFLIRVIHTVWSTLWSTLCDPHCNLPVLSALCDLHLGIHTMWSTPCDPHRVICDTYREICTM